MRLEEYLEALRTCPDEKLTEELGIYDNWPILLQGNYDEIVRDLESSSESGSLFSGEYRFRREARNQDGSVTRRYEYVAGTVELQFDPKVLDTTFPEQSPEHHERQLRDFTVNFCLHPYQDKKIPETSWKRAIAIVAEDICRYATKKGFALCLPHSVGSNYSEEFDRIVYFEPRTPAP